MLFLIISYWFRCVFFLFFKQKTAYEMRISDWSSDVCSSDLGGRLAAHGVARAARQQVGQRRDPRQHRTHRARAQLHRRQECLEPAFAAHPHARFALFRGSDPRRIDDQPLLPVDAGVRSEEHTSELQSLMRISYAVFCLKKKKQNNKRTE